MDDKMSFLITDFFKLENSAFTSKKKTNKLKKKQKPIKFPLNNKC